MSAHRQQRVPAARNAGAALATGECLAFLDGDDVWLPGKLAHQLELLDANPEAGYTYGTAVELEGDSLKRAPEEIGSPPGIY